MWIKEEIDGVEYYKLKRGAVRIFCILDPEGQSISFFPYQKKALSYAFRN
jgi:mRNA-degrading endonuclease RelE of RelBE toxin-antitoxin system